MERLRIDLYDKSKIFDSEAHHKVYVETTQTIQEVTSNMTILTKLHDNNKLSIHELIDSIHIIIGSGKPPLRTKVIKFNLGVDVYD